MYVRIINVQTGTHKQEHGTSAVANVSGRKRTIGRVSNKFERWGGVRIWRNKCNWTQKFAYQFVTLFLYENNYMSEMYIILPFRWYRFVERFKPSLVKVRRWSQNLEVSSKIHVALPCATDITCIFLQNKRILGVLWKMNKLNRMFDNTSLS